MACIAKIKTKSQLTIPKEIMEQLNLKVGDEVAFFVSDNKVEIKPIKTIAIPKDEQWAWENDTLKSIKETNKLFKAGKLKFYSLDNLDEMFKEWD